MDDKKLTLQKNKSGQNSFAKVFLFNPQCLIADRCDVGDSFMKRLIGLMGKKKINTGEALWIPRCTSIHMWFMKTSIDVLFLKKIKSESDKSIFKVISVHSSVKPWKFLPIVQVFSDDVLEMCEGTIFSNNIKKGDILCIEYSS